MNDQCGTTPDLALTTNDVFSHSGKISAGTKLHGIWLMDGRFYFPTTIFDGRIFINLATPSEVEPLGRIGDENERDSE